MEDKRIRQFMVAMGRYGIKRLAIKNEGFELELERECPLESASFESFSERTQANPLHTDFERRRSHGLHGQESHEVPALSEEAKDEGFLYIDSPMVGTLYHSPAPHEPSFVKIGDTIDENTVVCLVEAMKVMNEVKAGVRGIVAEILVEDSHPVEFGTRLFRLNPVKG
jgi:acetyl-CoA carboxylase biotin carboxyl carrier protein